MMGNYLPSKLFSTFHLLENLNLCGCNGLQNKQHSFKPFLSSFIMFGKISVTEKWTKLSSCKQLSHLTITYFHIVFNNFPSTIAISLLQYTKLLDVFESVNSFCLYHGLIPVTEKIAVPYSLQVNQDIIILVRLTSSVLYFVGLTYILNICFVL